ncbi:hypothetical protein [Lampropedia cohaerens]|nr:hypothetical protein [Lampropedia cohaerens]
MLASQAGELPRPAGAVMVDSVFMALGTIVMVWCYMLLPRPSRKLVAVTAEHLLKDIEQMSRRPSIANERWNSMAGRQLLTLA